MRVLSLRNHFSLLSFDMQVHKQVRAADQTIVCPSVLIVLHRLFAKPRTKEIDGAGALYVSSRPS
jgi:hypothetical protein